jgi:hypothetical protein
MAKYLATWKLNPNASWPKDPKENQKLIESLWAGADMLLKKGELVDWGAFINTYEGYCVFEGDHVSCMRGVMMFYPWIIMEARITLSLEETRKNTRELWEMRAKM